MKNVLIIDSDPVFCHEVTQWLEPMGMVVTTAESGDAGLEAAKANAPQLIVLSLEPGKTGYMLCRDLRKNDETAETRIILTSSTAGAADFEKHQKTQSRADVYLRKPVTPKEMITNVQDLLGMNDARPVGPGSDTMDPSLDFLDTSGDFGNTAEVSDSSNKELARLKSQLESLEQHNLYLKKEVDAFKVGTKMLEKQLSTKEKDLERLRDQAEDSAKLEDASHDLKVRMQQLEQEKSRHQLDLEEAVKRAEEASDEAGRLRHDLEAVNQRFQDQQTDLSHAREELEDRERQIHDLTGKLNEVTLVRGSKEEELEKAQDDKLAVEMELDGMRVEMETAKQETAKQAAQQEEALNQMLRDKEELQRDMEKLQKQHADLKDTLKQSQEKVERLDQDLAVAKASTSAVEKARSEENQKLALVRDEVTRLRGEISEQKARIAVAEEKQAGADKMLQARQVDLDKLKREYEELEKDRDHSLKEKERLEETFNKGIDNLKNKHEEDLRTYRSEWEREENKLRSNLKQLVTEKDAMVKGLTMEKAELQVKLDGRLAELNEKLTTSQQSFHEQKEMVFSLNKKLKALEEENMAEVERIRRAHETELSRVNLEAEEEQARVKSEHGKQMDELNKKVVALEQSNTGYEAQVSQLEKRLTDKDAAHAAVLDAEHSRVKELEGKVVTLEADLAREKESSLSLEDAKAKLNLQLQEQAGEHAKTVDDLNKRHEEAMDVERHAKNALVTELEGLRIENANLRGVQEAYENLSLETERLRLDRDVQRTRLEKVTQVLEAGMRELSGESLELELEEN